MFRFFTVLILGAALFSCDLVDDSSSDQGFADSEVSVNGIYDLSLDQCKIIESDGSILGFNCTIDVSKNFVIIRDRQLISKAKMLSFTRRLLKNYLCHYYTCTSQQKG